MRFYLELQNDILEEAYDEIYAVLRNLADNGITEDQLEVWKNQIQQDYLMDYNNPHNFSFAVIRYLNSGFGVPLMQNELNQFKSLTVEDINRVAEKYFDPDDFKIALIGNLKYECTSISERFEGIEYVDKLGNKTDPDSYKKKKEKELSDWEKGFKEGAEAGTKANEGEPGF